MEELKNLNRADLVDQLAEHTARFSKLFSEKKKDDAYLHTKQMIKLLTEELEARKNLETIKDKFEVGFS